ncbi:MAG: C69 family dipeptidase [Acidobacteriota bacterium]
MSESSKMKPLVTLLSLLLIPLSACMLSSREQAGSKAAAGCTTVIIGKRASADGSVIMAHNEDYGDNDCMHLVYHPEEKHVPGDVIRFAFEAVPQAVVTYAYTAIEMYSGQRLGMPPAKFLDGMNEFGVSMASNCIDCKEPGRPYDKGLGWPEIGQIVLQRCKTAREAVELSAKLVDQYTFNGFEATSCKNVTFLIADSNEGWIMEVTKKHWVARRCPDDGAVFYANQAQIETDWDLASADLVSYATAQHWYDPKTGKKFNFREAYGTNLGDPSNTMREARASELLAPKLGKITVQDLAGVMRDHYEGKTYYQLPHNRKTRPICVSSTDASQIYHLRGNLPPDIGCVMWSLVSSPCSGVYTPVWAGYGGGTPAEWQRGSDSYSSDSAWWAFESIQRDAAPLGNNNRERWSSVGPVITKRWDNIEKQAYEKVSEIERNALESWRRGEKGTALKLLTDYTNSRLHSDYLEACSILDWLKSRTAK